MYAVSVRSDSAWKASESLALGSIAFLVAWLVADGGASAVAACAVAAATVALVTIALTLRATARAESHSSAVPDVAVNSREPRNWRMEAFTVVLLVLGWVIGGPTTVASLAGICIGYGAGAAGALLVLVCLERRRHARFLVIADGNGDDRRMIELPTTAFVASDHRR